MWFQKVQDMTYTMFGLLKRVKDSSAIAGVALIVTEKNKIFLDGGKYNTNKLGKTAMILLSLRQKLALVQG